MSKIPKNAARSYTTLYLRFAVVGIFLIGYFVGMFTVSALFIYSVNHESAQMNLLGQVEFELSLA